MKREPQDILEKFILDHREDFDDANPSPRVWDQIQSGLGHHRRRNVPLRGWIWKAAAAVFFLSTSILILQNYWNLPSGEEIAFTKDFTNTEEYYTGLIQLKQTELRSQFTGDRNLIVEFADDIMELDSVYQVLKEEYQCNNDELVMDAMIRNLQIRLEIMDQQLQIIQHIKSNTRNDETVSI